MRAVIAYIPVLHRGYLDFLYGQRADRVYLIPLSLSHELRSLQKDIRALDAAEAVDALGSFVWAGVLTEEAIQFLRRERSELVMPDEDICHLVAERYFQGMKITWVSVSLRWDRQKSVAEQSIDPDEVVSTAELDRLLITKAVDYAKSSPDWWRQVGALIVKNGEITHCALNQPVPDGNLVLYEGDPRANFRRGEEIELSTALHAEAAIIAEAARRGPMLEGAKLYVSTFPCPACAKLVAYSGIKELYYREGYAMVDGRRIMRDKGVRVIRVQM